MDINDLDLAHFQIVKNEMIRRGLLLEERVSPNEFLDYEQTNSMSALANVPLKFCVAEEIDYDVPFMPCDNDLNLMTNNSIRI